MPDLSLTSFLDTVSDTSEPSISLESADIDGVSSESGSSKVPFTDMAHIAFSFRDSLHSMHHHLTGVAFPIFHELLGEFYDHALEDADYFAERAIQHGEHFTSFADLSNSKLAPQFIKFNESKYDLLTFSKSYLELVNAYLDSLTKCREDKTNNEQSDIDAIYSFWDNEANYKVKQLLKGLTGADLPSQSTDFGDFSADSFLQSLAGDADSGIVVIGELDSLGSPDGIQSMAQTPVSNVSAFTSLKEADLPYVEDADRSRHLFSDWGSIESNPVYDDYSPMHHINEMLTLGYHVLKLTTDGEVSGFLSYKDDSQLKPYHGVREVGIYAFKGKHLEGGEFESFIQSILSDPKYDYVLWSCNNDNPKKSWDDSFIDKVGGVKFSGDSLTKYLYAKDPQVYDLFTDEVASLVTASFTLSRTSTVSSLISTRIRSLSGLLDSSEADFQSSTRNKRASLSTSYRPLVSGTQKKGKGQWVNKGKEGEHGTFKTKKAADAQRKAMYANGFTGSSYSPSVYNGFISQCLSVISSDLHQALITSVKDSAALINDFSFHLKDDPRTAPAMSEFLNLSNRPNLTLEQSSRVSLLSQFLSSWSLYFLAQAREEQCLTSSFSYLIPLFDQIDSDWKSNLKRGAAAGLMGLSLLGSPQKAAAQDPAPSTATYSQDQVTDDEEELAQFIKEFPLNAADWQGPGTLARFRAKRESSKVAPTASTAEPAYGAERTGPDGRPQVYLGKDQGWTTRVSAADNWTNQSYHPLLRQAFDQASYRVSPASSTRWQAMESKIKSDCLPLIKRFAKSAARRYPAVDSKFKTWLSGVSEHFGIGVGRWAEAMYSKLLQTECNRLAGSQLPKVTSSLLLSESDPDSVVPEPDVPKDSVTSFQESQNVAIREAVNDFESGLLDRDAFFDALISAGLDESQAQSFMDEFADSAAESDILDPNSLVGVSNV